MKTFKTILLAAALATPGVIVAGTASAQVNGVAVADPEAAIANSRAFTTAVSQIQTTYKAQLDSRLVNGLVEPTTGRVTVDGRDVVEDGKEVRRRVGFVFTDPAAQLVMPTAAEDVALSLRRTHPKAERRAAAEQVLADFGLAGLGDRSVHGLSGGQRQLLALAGVLAVEPEVIVADEPTTLLDLGNARRIGDLLLGLPQQLVLVTHDLELAARCDRALLIRDGRVEKDGAAADVVEHYRETA